MKNHWKNARQTSCLIPLSNWGSFELIGPDSASFLQNLCTQDVCTLLPEQALWNALLDRKAKVLSTFLTQKTAQGLCIWAEKNALQVLIETCEKMHFSEEVEFKTSENPIFLIQGPLSEQVLDARKTFLDNKISQRLSSDFCGDKGVLISVEATHVNLVHDTLTEPAFGVPAIAVLNEQATELFKILILEAGLPLFDDLKDSLFSESRLHHLFVSNTKGCYPGQEIVARIASRGQTAKVLMGLEWNLNHDISIDHKNLCQASFQNTEHENIGRLSSAIFHPQNQVCYGLAFISQKYLDGDLFEATLSKDDLNIPIQAKVKQLPFWISPIQLKEAESLYTEGMHFFHHNDFKNAEEKFNLAISASLRFADAWEALGVLFERQQKVDEAIRVHKKFAELDPSSVMAHANLSRLYAQKGWIEKAEEEQNIATQKHFEWEARGKASSASKNILEENRLKMQAERERKKAIFLQVLEMDPEDDMALFGLGKIHLDSNEAALAHPYLEKLIHLQPNYSAAWPLWVKCLKLCQSSEQAQNALTQGIEVCEANRDLMPLKLLKSYEKEWARQNLKKENS